MIRLTNYDILPLQDNALRQISVACLVRVFLQVLQLRFQLAYQFSLFRSLQRHFRLDLRIGGHTVHLQLTLQVDAVKLTITRYSSMISIAVFQVL